MTKNANYYNVISVDGYSFPTAPQVIFRFISQGFTLLNRGSKSVEYSFDGVNVHGDLNPLDPTAGISFNSRFEDKIWFRGSNGFSTVRVEAWSGS